MTMPKATVYEHRNFFFLKYKVRVTFDRIIAFPAGNAILFKYIYQPQFC